jgi:hypothetical protein
MQSSGNQGKIEFFKKIIFSAFCLKNQKNEKFCQTWPVPYREYVREI